MEYGLIGLIVLVANIYALYHVFTSGAPTVNKVLWTLLILILPVIGFIAWLLAGPRGAAATA